MIFANWFFSAGTRGKGSCLHVGLPAAARNALQRISQNAGTRGMHMPGNTMS